MNLLNIPGFRLECKIKSLKNKIRLVCKIWGKVNYKKNLEEENSHLILLKLDGFAMLLVFTEPLNLKKMKLLCLKLKNN